MASTPLDIPMPRKPAGRLFYTWAAAIALAIVFAGFARTYYPRSWRASP